MNGQASFSLRGRNPDVLTCIANLSNDEVFTPPEFANRMLDTLAEAWAANNGGANIWADSSVRFLDPCTKSGVFLREITNRLIRGLADKIPNLEDRVNHILTKQVFGIGITHLTSLLARRSVYCSKHATGKHSIARSFDSDDGNIWFESIEHTWVDGTEVRTVDAAGKRIKVTQGGRCKYCGAGQSTFDRAQGLETHAYVLIHTDDVKATVANIFGGPMQFDVVVGNPPYQIEAEGNTRTMPIYQKFVDAALTLDPRYVLMITPSRWFAGGLGLDNFRDRMLSDKRLRVLVDYARMDTVFPGVDFEGGVSYFLWDRDHIGECDVTHYLGDEKTTRARRDLGEFDVFVRNPNALTILRKVLARAEPSITKIMVTNNEFGLVTNFTGFKDKRSAVDNIAVHAIKDSRRVVGWMHRKKLPKGDAFVDKWKVLIPKSYGERGTIPAQILGPILIAEPPSASTQTYVFVHADSEDAARIIAGYIRTRFFRFLLSLRKITQHAAKPVYSWVPQQAWDHEWSDEELYRKYKLTEDEISFIERMIRPMTLGEDGDDA
jgi:site-specific DNA-methyltransferase (adenine-specific)